MDFKNNNPIYLQVAEDIKRKIVTGEIKCGEKLSAITELALIYKINANTAQRVSKQLEMEGVCFVKRGVGTFITEDTNICENIRIELVAEMVKEFISGMKSIGYSKEESVNEINLYKGE